METTKTELVDRLTMFLTKYEGQPYSEMTEYLVNMEAGEFVKSYLKQAFDLEELKSMNDIKWKIEFVFSVKKDDKVKKITIKNLDLSPETE